MSDLKDTPAESPARRLPLISLRDLVVFPQMVTTLLLGRPRSVAALEASGQADGLLFLVGPLWMDPLFGSDPGIGQKGGPDPKAIYGSDHQGLLSGQRGSGSGLESDLQKRHSY